VGKGNRIIYSVNIKISTALVILNWKFEYSKYSKVRRRKNPEKTANMLNKTQGLFYLTLRILIFEILSMQLFR
jgi:hypothetical protein